MTSVESKEKIVTSHGIISPALVAIADQSSAIFSNGEELKTAWDVFYNTKVRSYQKLIEKSFNLILKYAGFPNANYEIVPFSPITLAAEETASDESTQEEDTSNQDTLPEMQ